MVTYTEWITIGHKVFKQKGGQYGDDTAVEATSVLAEYWSNNTDELKSASKSEARNIAQSEMKV